RRGLAAGPRHGEGAVRALARGPRPLQAHPPPGVRAAAQDRLRQDPPDRAARGDGGRVGRRVPRGGLPVTSEPSYTHGTGTTALLGDTIGANLDRAVAAWPDREALVDVPSGRRWTYARFTADVDELASALLG